MTVGDYVGIASGLLITVLFFYFGIRVGRRNRTRPVIKYCSDFDRLITEDDGILSDGIVVTQHGHEVGSISRTCVALWNDRGDTIDSADILPSDPLRLSLDLSDRVIQARVLSRSREQNSFKIIDKGSDGVAIEFDFLDADDGAIVEIIHQGEKPVRLVGTVRGATIEPSGGADLSSETLRILANAGYWARFYQYWWAAGHKRRARLAFYAFNFLFVGSAGVFFGVRYLAQKPRIVPLHDYDLTAIEGQRRFASEVLKVGAQDDHIIWMIVIPGGMLAISVLALLFVSVIPSIPREILATYGADSTKKAKNADGTMPPAS